MKRTPLTRGTSQLKRTRLNRSSKKRRQQLADAKADGSLQDFAKWRDEQTHCYFCGWKLGQQRIHSGWLTRLEANHIFGHALRGATRFDIWAIVMLDQWCHQEVWSRFRDRQRVLFGAALKIENDPKHFKLDEMNELLKPAEPITLTELREFLDTALPALRRNH